MSPSGSNSVRRAPTLRRGKSRITKRGTVRTHPAGTTIGGDDYADALDLSFDINSTATCRYSSTCVIQEEDTIGATLEGGEGNTCTFNSNVVTFKSTVWYRFQATLTGIIDMRVAGQGAGFVPLLLFGDDYFSGPTTCWLADAGSQSTGVRSGVVGAGSTAVVGVASQASGNDGTYDISFSWDPDSDGDGLVDSDDRCDGARGPSSLRGCPDRDGDRIPDIDDRCDTLRGPASLGGCPDSDGDGLIDPSDRCPRESSRGRTDRNGNGCPDHRALPDISARTSAGRVSPVRGVPTIVTARIRLRFRGKAPRGTKIKITCRPRRNCRIKRRGSLSKRLRSVRLRTRKTRVTVTATKSGYIGKVLSFKAGYRPSAGGGRTILPGSSKNRCIPIGRKRSAKCTRNIFLR